MLFSGGFQRLAAAPSVGFSRLQQRLVLLSDGGGEVSVMLGFILLVERRVGAWVVTPCRHRGQSRPWRMPLPLPSPPLPHTPTLSSAVVGQTGLAGWGLGKANPTLHAPEHATRISNSGLARACLCALDCSNQPLQPSQFIQSPGSQQRVTPDSPRTSCGCLFRVLQTEVERSGGSVSEGVDKVRSAGSARERAKVRRTNRTDFTLTHHPVCRHGSSPNCAPKKTRQSDLFPFRGGRQSQPYMYPLPGKQI
ncbi:hypothetical protein HDK90DRAFT_129983 [Phyllosticta capitalensis]|uniref:Uncharacterized protein n=1 Tax=Phyllosticta capitalensis TaxID=121624 RepID=A0ABR1YYA5_9PEZI